MTDLEKINLVNNTVKDYFKKNKSIEEIPVKELMPDFIKVGLFEENHKDGYPIREFLRQLRAEGKLDLITNIKTVDKPINTFWYFVNNEVK